MRFAALLSVALMLTIGSAAVAAEPAKTKSGAESFVSGVVDQAMTTIKDKRDGKLTDEQAKVTFRKILNNSFDIPTIARFTLGKYWRVATPAQQAEYTALLRTKILEKYADRILSYSGNGFKVTGSRPLNEKDTAVAMKIDRAGEAPVDFGWRVRNFKGTYKVIDISVEGISMSVTHRSDFASEIERNGGKVQALLDALKSKKTFSADEE